LNIENRQVVEEADSEFNLFPYHFLRRKETESVDVFFYGTQKLKQKKVSNVTDELIESVN